LGKSHQAMISPGVLLVFLLIQRNKMKKIAEHARQMQREKNLVVRNVPLPLLVNFAPFRIVERAIITRKCNPTPGRSRSNNELLATAGAKMLRVVSPLILGVGAHGVELRHAVLVREVLAG